MLHWKLPAQRFASAVCLLQIAIASNAQAKIVCQGPYQVNKGTTLRSPYCETEYLATIARGFGIEVSGAQIRDSYSLKKRVCQVVDSDNRAESICIGTGSEPLY
jgi:hypothetical protein